MERSASSHRAPCLALVGNPNSGKTTLFNALTGSRYKVANYPGVTVEKKEGSINLCGSTPATIIDLPGTYALSGSTIDEEIVTKFLSGSLAGSSKPDLIVAVVDATNIERNLFVVSELIDTGLPIVVALNMMDSAQERGIKIYVDLLGRLLDVPIVPIVARSSKGLPDLENLVRQELARPTTSRRAYAWIPSDNPRALDIRHAANPCCMSSLDATMLTTIASLRYLWIRNIVGRVVSGPNLAKQPSARIDAVLTSKVWGLPIFVAIVALIFQAIFLWAQVPMES